MNEMPRGSVVRADDQRHWPDDHPRVAYGKVGVLLLNLGTPDATDYWSMRRYLKEFLSDTRVIEEPRWKWWPILNLVILTVRPGRKGKDYATIWNTERNEGPLKTITRNQAEALALRLAGHPDVIVDWAMRYANPTTESRIAALQKAGCERILLVPLYPQYAAATTATACDQAFRALMKMRWQPFVRVAPAYHDDPAYIDALARSMQKSLAGLDFERKIMVKEDAPALLEQRELTGDGTASEATAAMMDNLRFWLDKGVDGFRVDVMNHIIKAKDMPDNPLNPMWKEGDHPYRRLIPQYSQDQPEVHDIVAMMRKVFDSYEPPRLIIGEIYLPIERLVTYYGPNGHGAHLPFNFQLVTKPWDARIIASTIDRYEAALPPHAWPNWVLGNHDRPRIATRVGREQCRVAAMALLTLRGTPTMYYGDELGMQNVYIRSDQLVDPPGIEIGIEHSRDPERTPMQWDNGPNAGFTTAKEPWLPVSADYKYTNVAFQTDDPLSTLNLYHRLIELRRAEPALSVGSYTGIPAEGDIVTYIREHEDSRLFVALNFGASPAEVDFDGYAGTVVISTYHDRAGEEAVGPLHVRANEGVVVRLT